MRDAIQKLTEDVRTHIRARPEVGGDEDIRRYSEDRVSTNREYAGLSVAERIRVVDTVLYKTRKKLSILQPFVDDGSVSEIMVNGPRDIFIEKAGRVMRADAEFDGTEELEEVMRRIAADVHREINELTPILDARLADGSRVNAVYKNVALNGPILTIRKFPESRITMDELLAYGTITQAAADFLIKLVQAAYNIFISGGTSSGKTTFLNVLSNFIPKHERIVTIEDAAELQISALENIVKLECRSANANGKGGVGMTQLIRASLRMRPDRIIVGEVRGAEVLDMIQAMNTGHSGSLSTGHANSPAGMLYRLEAMFLQAADYPIAAIRRQITEGIDILVHLGRIGGGRRVALEISEITGMVDGEITLNKLFDYSPERGLFRTGNPLRDQTKLKMKGMKW
ncbi:MAG: Flp pilus assembly complex ATPase component TadA [Clostridiales Family XIII bacterium]|jgi:pilus assembly protein CpaF|nr:Flp pilus assembly complex ATPase component TadA [Clostridiales Family XIII bacterium]